MQIAAGVMLGARRWLPKGSGVSAHSLLVAGGAAGIAAAFNTPLAGVMFAIEELSRSPEQRNSGLIVAGIVLAGLIAVSVHGNGTHFGVIHPGPIGLALLWPGLLAALASGCAGGLFARLLLTCLRGESPDAPSRWRARHPVWFAAGCGLLVALIGALSGGATYGSGNEATRSLLENEASLPGAFTFFKFVATWLTAWSGVPAGIFAPSLSIGAALGHDIALLTGYTHGAALIALGMVGFLAAATQAPLTAFIIVMEMVDAHSMVLSLMACAVVASTVSRVLSPPLYGRWPRSSCRPGHCAEDIQGRPRSLFLERISSDGRHRGAMDAVPRQRLRHESARFHRLDKVRQEGRRFIPAAFRRTHRLLDHHEASVQQAQVAQAPGIRFELLFDASRNFRSFLQEGIDHRRRARGMHDARMPQAARQVQIVGAAFADDHTVSGIVDLFVGADRRLLLHHVAAFDQRVGRGEGNVLAAYGIDGEETDIGVLRHHDIHRFAGGVHDHQFQFRIEQPGELGCQVDGYAAGPARRVTAGEDGVAQVDRGAQLAAWSEGCLDPRIQGHGVGRVLKVVSSVSVSTLRKMHRC